MGFSLAQIMVEECFASSPHRLPERASGRGLKLDLIGRQQPFQHQWLGQTFTNNSRNFRRIYQTNRVYRFQDIRLTWFCLFFFSFLRSPAMTMDEPSDFPVLKVPARQIIALEHPMIIKNLDNGIKTFGRNHPFQRVRLCLCTYPEQISLHVS